MTEETDYIIEIPELEGQDVPSGVPIKLSVSGESLRSMNSGVYANVDRELLAANFTRDSIAIRAGFGNRNSSDGNRVIEIYWSTSAYHWNICCNR